MGVFTSIAQILLVVINICLFVIGGIILGIGIWIKINRSNIFQLMKKVDLDETGISFGIKDNSIFDVIGLILIILGAFTFVTAFFGCCGAMTGNNCCLTIYAFLVSAIVVCQIAVGIYAGVQKTKFEKQFESILLNELIKDFNGILSKNPSMFTKLLTFSMLEYKCCGIRSEKEFSNTKQKWQQNFNGMVQQHPVGCCKLKKPFTLTSDDDINIPEIIKLMEDPSCPYSPKTKLNTDGCITVLIEKIKSNLSIVIGICVGLGLFEILCIIFACSVIKKPRR